MFRIKLKELRENAGLSQSRFAEQFGVAQSTVGNWESGTREPNLETIKRIAIFFGVSLDYLFGNTDNPTPAATKKSVPELGTPEWLRLMFTKLGINVDELTNTQVDMLVRNADSLAKMFREEIAKNRKE